MPPEQAGQVQAVEEEADQGSGAHLQGLQADAGGQGGVVMATSRRATNGTREEIGAAGREATVKKSWPGWPAGQPGQDFLAVKGEWTRGRGRGRVAGTG